MKLFRLVSCRTSSSLFSNPNLSNHRFVDKRNGSGDGKCFSTSLASTSNIPRVIITDTRDLESAGFFKVDRRIRAASFFRVNNCEDEAKDDEDPDGLGLVHKEEEEDDDDDPEEDPLDMKDLKEVFKFRRLYNFQPSVMARIERAKHEKKVHEKGERFRDSNNGGNMDNPFWYSEKVKELSEKGRIVEANELVLAALRHKTMSEAPKIELFNTLLKENCVHGEGFRSYDWIKEMRQRKLVPDVYSFTLAIDAFSNAPLVDKLVTSRWKDNDENEQNEDEFVDPLSETDIKMIRVYREKVLKLHNKMLQLKVEPNLIYLNCLLKFLSRIGDLEAMVELVPFTSPGDFKKKFVKLLGEKLESVKHNSIITWERKREDEKINQFELGGEDDDVGEGGEEDLENVQNELEEGETKEELKSSPVSLEFACLDYLRPDEFSFSTVMQAVYNVTKSVKLMEMIFTEMDQREDLVVDSVLINNILLAYLKSIKKLRIAETDPETGELSPMAAKKIERRFHRAIKVLSRLERNLESFVESVMKNNTDKIESIGEWMVQLHRFRPSMVTHLRVLELCRECRQVEFALEYFNTFCMTPIDSNKLQDLSSDNLSERSSTEFCFSDAVVFCNDRLFSTLASVYWQTDRECYWEESFAVFELLLTYRKVMHNNSPLDKGTFDQLYKIIKFGLKINKRRGFRAKNEGEAMPFSDRVFNWQDEYQKILAFSGEMSRREIEQLPACREIRALLEKTN